MPSDLTLPLHTGADQEMRATTIADVFKRFLAVSCLVVAALPAPVALLRLLPTFTFQTQELAVYGCVASYLLLAIVFYSRHLLGRWMLAARLALERSASPGAQRLASVKGFLMGVVPWLAIVACFYLAYRYQVLVDSSITAWGRTAATSVKGAVNLSPSELYVDALDKAIPASGDLLLAYYVGMFLMAELAFALIALKEYLIDSLGVDDGQLIRKSVN